METIIISKVEWYLSRILYTFIISIFIGLVLGFVLCMMNIGLLIDGYADDNIIGIILLITSLYLGWKASYHAAKGIDKSTNPFKKIIYEGEKTLKKREK